MKLLNKKANVEGATPLMVLMVVGMGIAVLTILLVAVMSGNVYELVEDDIDEIGSTLSVDNQSFTISNTSEVFMGQDHIIEGTLTVTNATGIVSLIDNLTIDYVRGTAQLLTAYSVLYNGKVLNATYSYRNDTVGNIVKNSIFSSFEALEDTGGYLPVIVTGLVIVLVLGIILTSLYGRKGLGGGGDNSAL